MTIGNFELFDDVREIRALPAGQRFVAKAVAIIQRHSHGTSTRIPISLGEFWGLTETEAMAKLREAFNSWVQDQSIND
jgi:hypothetical protein